MSPLGKLLRSMRLKRNISELKAARRANIPLERFIEFERSPEDVPINLLSKVFSAIEITPQEYIDFNIAALALSNNYKKPTELTKKLKSKNSKFYGNLLKFTDKKGIRKNKNIKTEDILNNNENKG